MMEEKLTTVEWSRPPSPQAEFTITLSEESAMELAGLLGKGDGIAGECYLALADALDTALGEDWDDNPAAERGRAISL